MDIGKRRRFIVNVTYWAIIAAIAYLVFRYLLNLLLPFVIALLVAWLLRPICKFYRRKIPGHSKLTTAMTVATVILFYLVVSCLVLLFAANLVSSLASYASRLPQWYTESLEPGLKNLYLNAQSLAARFDPAIVEVVNKVLPEVFSAVSGAITSFSVSAVGKLTNVATAVPSYLLSGVIAIIATIFMATAFDSMKGFFARNLPEKVRVTGGYVIDSFRKILGLYGKSYLLVMLITFCEICLGLLIIGVKHAPLIALLIALFDIFPIVGAGMILLPWAIVTFIQGRILRGIGLAILYVVVIVVRQFLEPKLVGKQVGLPPLVTLACMFVGSSLFGVWGLFGFPITAAIITNLNNDPDVPINLFKPEEKEAEVPAGKIVYRFRRRNEKDGKSGKAAKKKKEDPGKSS